MKIYLNKEGVGFRSLHLRNISNAIYDEWLAKKLNNNSITSIKKRLERISIGNTQHNYSF